MKQSGLKISQPIAVWNRSLDINFRDLFKALGKGFIDASIGQWGGLGKSMLDASAAVGLANSPEQIAWLLIYRSLSQAMANLAEDSKELMINQPNNLELLCTKLDLSLEEVDLVIDDRFFNQPYNFLLLDLIQAPLTQLLEPFLSTPYQAKAIASRLPSYFVFSLDKEWRERANEYTVLFEHISTPFTQASQREQEWRLYSAWLTKQIDEPMFLEAFGLRQVYVPQLAYYQQRSNSTEASYQDEQVEKVVIDLEEDLEIWLKSEDKTDAIRIISGGPGSGKSSFAKVFAARQSAQHHRVLFVPLHQFDPTGNLETALSNFIKYDSFLSFNPLNPQNISERILIIFDGLDELALQGRIAMEVAQDFIREVQRKVERYNLRETLLKVLITSREIVVQHNSSEFRQSRQILHLLPYFTPENTHDIESVEKYIDPHQKMKRDRRQDWWRQYGIVGGKGYEGMPWELNQGNLIEITAQPLLNYLVALSYAQGKLSFTEKTNLNQIYYSLLKAVYERGYEQSRPHASLQGMEQSDFIRVLEEIALASWHGDGRTTTVKEIEAHCDSSGLRSLLKVFEEGAQAGVTRLLAAFYFRQSSGIRDGERTFEFTHKSFGEYLTARRIVRCTARIHTMLERRKQDVDEGWDTREALVYWAKICASPTEMSYYLFDFVKDEVALQPLERVKQWQSTLVKIFNYLMRHWMPMERLAPRNTAFRDECIRARHAEISLLAMMSACARITKAVSEVEWSWAQSFGGLFSTLNGQRTSDDKSVLSSSLSYLNLRNCTLAGQDLRYADLRGADLTGADLSNTNLSGANLRDLQLKDVCLIGTNLRGADLRNVTLLNTNLSEANLRGASLDSITMKDVSLTEANLRGASLRNSTLEDVSLTEANLRGANLRNSTLKKVSLTEANLLDSDLKGVDWQEVNLDNTNHTGLHDFK